MLRLDAPREAEAPAWPVAPVADIVARLESDGPETVAVCGIANAWLAHDVALAQAIAGAAPMTALADLERSLEIHAGEVEPGTLARAAADRDDAAELRFTPGSADDRFDMLPRRSGAAACWPAAATDGPLCNDPLGDELASKRRRDLQERLVAALGGQGLARVELMP